MDVTENIVRDHTQKMPARVHKKIRGLGLRV